MGHVDSATGAVHVAADPDDDVDADDTAPRKAPIDLREAATRARAATPGTVLSVEFDSDDHRPGHGCETKIKGSDGATHEPMVDARTGAVTADDEVRSHRDDDRRQQNEDRSHEDDDQPHQNDDRPHQDDD
ncbi:PepSY domain-containing protein [Streptomyces odontomachi]|uniref:PepSY domain-containing protein n=1 Tax=Streptomyces odontomachi TaxID=2944940 RepID=UPI00210A5807|nr:hypothetical protein [Streptomyces sp. ODS25]